MKRSISDVLADASLDGMHAFDLDQRYTYWNAAMERISGMRAAEVIGRRAPEVFAFLAEGEESFHQRALRGETVVSRDRAFAVPETGRRGWVESHYAPLRDAGGEIIGAIAIVRDITERKLAAARIAETEQRFQNMADASPVLLWMAGVDSLCTFFNQTWLAFTGRTLQQEWGIGWAEGVHFEDLQACLDTYEHAFSERRAFEMEYRLRRADGEFRWILDRGSPRYEPDGTFAGYIGSCTDITDRKTLEAELQTKLRVRDEFLSIASHELRTPLSALQLNLDGMVRFDARDGGISQEDRARRLRLMQGSVRRLEQLIARLLDVSRLREAGTELEPVRFDLADAVRDACDRMGAEIATTGSSLHIETEPMLGVWDRERIDQVVVNLLSNAAKYGQGKPIHVRVGGDADSALVIVRDSGIGVAPDDHRRIFQRFERAVSPRSFGGFGLGLWIANEIATASGGRIDVTSGVGMGATFTVTLPRARQTS